MYYRARYNAAFDWMWYRYLRQSKTANTIANFKSTISIVELNIPVIHSEHVPIRRGSEASGYDIGP